MESGVPGSPHDSSALRRVRLFGTMRLENAEGAVPLRGERTQSLLAYLILRGGRPRSREIVAEALWPDAPKGRGRRRLSNTLSRLRQAVGDGWVSVHDSTLAIHDLESLWVDVWAFDELGDAEGEVRVKTLELYTDDLLPDIYDDWVVPHRERLRRRYLVGLQAAADEARSRGDLTVASRLFGRLNHADPLSEPGHVGLIQTLDELGRTREAFAAYERLVEIFDAELHTEPGGPARELGRRLRRDLDARGPESGTQSRRPFIGRTAERTRLLEQLSLADRGQGGLSVILGEPGIGKTRLLEEVAASARWRGWTVSAGSADQFAGAVAHTPLRQALDELLTVPRIEQLTEMIEPIWLALAARIIPRIRQTLTTPEVHVPPADRRAIGRALTQIVAGLSRASPQLVVLDDMQWADVATWDVVDLLRETLSDCRALVIIAARSSEAKAMPAAWDQIVQWDASAVPVVSLGPLPPEGVKELVMACIGRPVPDAVLERAPGETGGNPLLAIAWARELEESGPPDRGTGPRDLGTEPPDRGTEPLDHDAEPVDSGTEPLDRDAEPVDRGTEPLDRDAGPLDSGPEPFERGTQPLSIAGIARSRLGSLSPGATDAIRTAAVLGRRFDYRLWSEASSRLEQGALPSLVGELELAGLVWAGEQHYRFVHDSLRGAIYLGMSEDERALRHRKAFEALDALMREDLWGRLHHAREAGLRQHVGILALAAAQEALSTFSLEQAVSLSSEAVDQLPRADLESLFEALRLRALAHDLLGDRESEGADIAELRAVAEAVGESGKLAMVARMEAGHAARIGELDRAEAAARAGLKLVQASQSTEVESALLETLALVARDRGDFRTAETWLQRALECCQRGGYPFGVASARDKMAHLQWRQGHFRAAQAGHEQAARVFAAEGAVFHEATARSGLAVVKRKLGDYRGARRGHLEVLERARELGMTTLEWAQMVTLGNIGTELGDFATAVQWYGAALELARRNSDRRGESMTLGNLAEAYRDLGEHRQAVRAYDEAMALNREHGFKGGLAYNLMGRARAYLDVREPLASLADFENATTAWRELNSRMELAETLAGRALALVEVDRVADAQRFSQTALALTRGADHLPLLQWVHYSVGRVAAARGDDASHHSHFRAAQRAMSAMAESLPADERERFLSSVPNNRLLRAAIAELKQTVEVRLVRSDVPLGRSLTDEDYVVVTWTVFALEETGLRGKVARRQSTLRRLLSEASEQGAAPTDVDLAKALGVSRRTILRDMRVLASQGVALRTRRRD